MTLNDFLSLMSGNPTIKIRIDDNDPIMTNKAAINRTWRPSILAYVITSIDSNYTINITAPTI